MLCSGVAIDIGCAGEASEVTIARLLPHDSALGGPGYRDMEHWLYFRDF